MDVPVGGMIIFSGSKSHAGIGYCLYHVFVFKSHTLVFKGSGYLIGNRRLHFYFFSTNTWKNFSSPVSDLDMYRSIIQQLDCSDIRQDTRNALETKLLALLEVYDIENDEGDAFDDTDNETDGNI